MRFRLRSAGDSMRHINYVPAEGLDDAQLEDQISRMSNASEANPRKIALRQERIARRIAEIGLDQAELQLGIGDSDG